MTVTMTTPGDVKPVSARSDIGSQLDALPVGRVHRKVVVAIGLGLFFEVYEIFLSSSIATALKTEYHLGGTALQLLMASSFIGMFIGAAAFGRIADRIGRRKAFLLNLVWFSVCSLLAAVAPTPALLVAARFLAGIGIGAEYPVADSYLSDVLPKAHRGRLAAWAYTCSFLAVPALGFLALGLSGRTILGVDGWRVLLLIGAVGAVFVDVDAARTTRVAALARREGPHGRGPGRPERVRGGQRGRTDARHRADHRYRVRPPIPSPTTDRRRIPLRGFVKRPTGGGWRCWRSSICSSPSATTGSGRWRGWCWWPAASTSPRRCCSPRCRSSGTRWGR